jgi:hypothetical protein
MCIDAIFVDFGSPYLYIGSGEIGVPKITSALDKETKI